MTVKTVNTNLEVMNIALVGLLGEKAILDTVSTTPGKTCAQLYRPLVLEQLSAYPWKFAMKKKADTTSDITPINEWKYGFSLDAVSDFISLVAVYDSSEAYAKPMKEFERFGKYIYANVSEIWYDYVYDIPEENWPAWFVKLVATALAADLAIPITDQTSKADKLEIKAFGYPAENQRGGLFGKATNRDSVESPTKTLVQDQGSILEYRNS